LFVVVGLFLYRLPVVVFTLGMRNSYLSAMVAATLVILSSHQTLRANVTFPAKVIDLSSWKVTLPVVKKGAENAAEIKPPKISTFSDPQYFFTDVTSENPVVVFRAPCGGATTKNSKYPRCELREMSKDGKSRASWSTDDQELHTLTMRAAITHIPNVKKHVVCAQIHDSKNDLIMIRLEGKHLFIERNPFEDVSIDKNYKLGTPFDLKIQAGTGKVKVWYNEDQKMDWVKSTNGCYFKAGCYTQSNPQKGDKPDSYGEVQIHQLTVKHSKSKKE